MRREALKDIMTTGKISDGRGEGRPTEFILDALQ